jgi:hypothetical protein
MRGWWCLAAVSLLASAASAASAQTSEPGRRSLTIYNSDLALVEEHRALNLPAGRTRVEFKGVSAAIRPETVALSAKGVSIVEQNFDFDLLSPAKLMEKAVGQEVQIVRTNPGNGQQVTETATVLAVNGGVVLRIGDRIEVLRDDGVPTRVIFPKVPDNLRPRPTLSVTLESAAAGPRDAVLSYLTKGLGWKADYVANFDEKAGRLDLQGWITLTNTSGTTFQDAEAQLVAGDINLQEPTPYRPWRPQPPRRANVQGGSESGDRPPVADYYLYPLPGRTTIADNQTKQVGFLTAAGVTARKAYQYRASWFQSLETPEHADVVVDFANAASGGLGAQLPAGVVRVYVRDAAGEPKFVGEDAIEHTPAGSELSIKTGEAFDVTVQPTLTEQARLSSDRTRYSMSYLVHSARSEPVMVEIRQSGLGRSARVKAESLPSRRLDASTLLWSVPVPANGDTKLTFTVDNEW